MEGWRGTGRGAKEHLAREDVAECGERIVEGLVVDRLVEVLDVDVAHTGASQGRFVLGPHDAHRTSLK